MGNCFAPKQPAGKSVNTENTFARIEQPKVYGTKDDVVSKPSDFVFEFSDMKIFM